MDPSQISACVVTRGDVDLSEIRASLASFGELVVWDNSAGHDLGVYGRYEAVRCAASEVVYVQDDDCVLDECQLGMLTGLYEPDVVVANMPVGRWDDYPDSCLVGWGAVFDRALAAETLGRFIIEEYQERIDYAEGYSFIDAKRLRADPKLLFRECDGAFTTLAPHRKVDVGFRHLPWAEDPERALFLQPGHREARDRMLDLARQVRDQVPA